MIRRSQQRSARLTQLSLVGMTLAASVAVNSSAQAQNAICFPPPAPVPWLGGAPTWAESDLYKPLNDPRWGSFAIRNFDGDKGEKETGEGGFRLVRQGSELSVSIQNKADTAPALSDYATFGLHVPGGNAVAIKVKVNVGGRPRYYTHVSTDASADLSGNDVTTYRWTGGENWTPTTGYPPTGAGNPQWVVRRSIASWTTQPVSEGGAFWGIQFKVNLAALGILDDTPVNVFIGMHDQLTTTNGNDVTTPTPDPMGTPPNLISGTHIFADPTRWSRARTIREGCLPGLYIEDAYQIGTSNTPNNDVIVADAGVTNRFYANVAGADRIDGGIAARDLVARFRYANWGAQPWETINQDGVNWLPIGNGNSVPNGVRPRPAEAVSPTNPTPGITTFTFDCPQNTSTTVCGGPKPAAEHQCMVVDFSPAPNKSFAISNGSMYRNMRFVGLSKRTLPADISLKGLTAATGRNLARDVIVRVVTHNMPAPTYFPLFLDSALLNTLKLAVLGVAQIFNPLGLSLKAAELMKSAWPTYEVHVYYDTGRKAFNNGVEYKVMQPMNSFGYHFSHSGIYFGFTHGFGGPGFRWLDNAGKLLLAERVPAESVLKVQTGVETVDIPPLFTDMVKLACEVFPFACRPQ